jgi:hypothetical protein
MLKLKIFGVSVLFCFLALLISCGEAGGSPYEPLPTPTGDNPYETGMPTPGEDNPHEGEETAPNGEPPLPAPPSFIGLRLPMAPFREDMEVLSFTPDDNYSDLPITSAVGRYLYDRTTATWIELYFETVADIDLLSVWELFRVEAFNNALTFTPQSIRNDDFTLDAPREGWEGYRRLEIRGLFLNTPNSSMITFRILPGLADTQGNRSDEDFSIMLKKSK